MRFKKLWKYNKYMYIVLYVISCMLANYLSYGQFQPVVIIYEEPWLWSRGGQLKIIFEKGQYRGLWPYRSVGKVDNGWWAWQKGIREWNGIRNEGRLLAFAWYQHPAKGEVGHHLSILPTLPIANPVRRVFPLLSSKPSLSPHLRVQPFASPLLLGPSSRAPRDTRCMSGSVPLLSLFCMPDERHVDSWR